MSDASMGHYLAREGAERAADHAEVYTPDWRGAALRCLLAYKGRGDTFTTEDVREFAENVRGLPAAPDGRAWGSVMTAAARMRVIVATAVYIPSRFARSHRNPKRVWRWAP